MAVKNSHIPSVDLPSGFIVKSMRDESRGKENRKPSPHRHNFYTMIWIKKVDGVHQIDFQDYELTPDTIQFVAPEQVHCIDSQDTNPDGFIYLFNDDFLAMNNMDRKFLARIGIFEGCITASPVRKVTSEAEDVLKSITDKMLIEYTQSNPYKTEKLGALLKLFLLECSGLSMLQAGLPGNEPAKVSRVFREFMLAIRDHFNTLHKVSDYADLLHITPNYLNEVVKSETGKSAKEFILNQIILEAKRFATHSDMSLKEIAYTLGFEDPSNFSKFFKKYAGIDYSNFREQVREKLVFH